MDPTPTDLENRFAGCLQRQDLEGARAAAADLRQHYPALEKGWVYGSMAYLMGGDPASGRALLATYLSRHPPSIAVLLQRGECELALGLRTEAIATALEARALAAQEPAALDAVGVFLTHAAAHTEALETYEQALILAPTATSLLLGRAVLSRYLGRFEQARADYAAILAREPQQADALKGRADVTREAPRPEEIGELTAALRRSEANPDEQVTLHFALGKAYEDLGDHAASWQNLTAGNDLHRARLRYDPALDAAVIDGLIAGFPAPRTSAPPSGTDAPIFIVGLPRTGTTLVERILGSHPSVHAAGELSALSEALTGLVAEQRDLAKLDWLGYVAGLATLDPKRLAAAYLDRARAWRGARARFTDKQPTNFYYCGWILEAFPNARIIHVTRHPLAAVHAIYKTFFPRTYPFSYRLDELAEYYVGYHRLMAHWQRLYPGRIHSVAYEELVGAQETTTRLLLDACALDFDPACLQFETHPGASTTASAVQVRQPIYDSSLALWRHHELALVPVRRRLAQAGIVVD